MLYSKGDVVECYFVANMVVSDRVWWETKVKKIGLVLSCIPARGWARTHYVVMFGDKKKEVSEEHLRKRDDNEVQ